MDPSGYITIAVLAYNGVNKAWAGFRSAINYHEDTADLVIQLELERFRFQTWGRSTGLANGTLEETLHPVFHEIRDRLNRIEAIFHDTNQLKESFGLLPADRSGVTVDMVQEIILRMGR